MLASKRTPVSIRAEVHGPAGVVFTGAVIVTELQSFAPRRRVYVFPFTFDESGLDLPDGNYTVEHAGGHIKAIRLRGRFLWRHG